MLLERQLNKEWKVSQEVQFLSHYVNSFWPVQELGHAKPMIIIGYPGSREKSEPRCEVCFLALFVQS